VSGEAETRGRRERGRATYLQGRAGGISCCTTARARGYGRGREAAGRGAILVSGYRGTRISPEATAPPSFARRGKRGRRSSARARRTHVSARSLSDYVVEADLRRGKGSKGHSSPRARDVARVICARHRARSTHGRGFLASGRGASERTGSMYRLNDASAATASTFTSRGISTALHLLRG
jgi:hypothetical protein